MSGTGVRHIRAAPKELIMEDKAPQLRKRKKRGWAHVGAGADKEPTFDVGYDAGLDDVGLGVVLKFLLIPIFCLICLRDCYCFRTCFIKAAF